MSVDHKTQVVFLQQLQRILAEGLFSSTYKFALLHTLADLSILHGDESGNALALSIGSIAERFLELYWTHAIPYPGASQILLQNSGKQARILTRIQEAQDLEPSLARFRAKHPEAWANLRREAARTIREMPLGKLQNLGGEKLEFLYTRTRTGVLLKPGVAYCFRAFHSLILDLVRGAWVRHVRNRNTNALGDTVDLSTFLFGTERSNLSRHARILRDLQKNTCFYCQKPLKSSGEVDHFIPWTRYPVDLGHNFVLAHTSCNQNKSDKLASVVHLENWCRRNEDLHTTMVSLFDESGILHDLPSSQRVASWSYTQAQSVGAKLWSARKTPLVNLDLQWRSLPGMKLSA